MTPAFLAGKLWADAVRAAAAAAPAEQLEADDPIGGDVCEWCRLPMPPRAHTGRPRSTCSDRCRAALCRARRVGAA